MERFKKAARPTAGLRFGGIFLSGQKNENVYVPIHMQLNEYSCQQQQSFMAQDIYANIYIFRVATHNQSIREN